MLSARKYVGAALLGCVRVVCETHSRSPFLPNVSRDVFQRSTCQKLLFRQTRFMGRYSNSVPAARIYQNRQTNVAASSARSSSNPARKRDSPSRLPIVKNNYVGKKSNSEPKHDPKKRMYQSKQQNDRANKPNASYAKKTNNLKSAGKGTKTTGSNTKKQRGTYANSVSPTRKKEHRGTKNNSTKKKFAFGAAVHPLEPPRNGSERNSAGTSYNVKDASSETSEADANMKKRVRRRPLPVKWNDKAVYIACPQANTIASALRRLKNGLPVCIKPENRYSSVIRLYSRLKNRLGERNAIASFDEHQQYTRRVRKVFENLLLPLGHINGEVRLSGVPGPAVPKEWLPEGPYIPIRSWFGLQSAAYWAQTGVKYKQLDSTIYPQPGCYFAVPSSAWVCEHFALFDDWLHGSAETSAGLTGVRTAVDVGTGCGVLSLLMLKHGAERVTAVDINPAAIATVADTATRLGLDDRLTARFSDLVPSDLDTAPELIVFNPPWFPCAPNNDGHAGVATMRHNAAHLAEIGDAVESDLLATSSPRTRDLLAGDHWLEAASYRDPTLMESFFDSSYATLAAHGRVCVIYSNYARLVGKEPGLTPMEVELESSDRFELVEMIRRPVPVSRRVKSGKEKGYVAVCTSQESIYATHASIVVLR
eukprot:m.980326 g.980326  ORF g.980326 m.980326 type:complete len:649 (+) comp23964_c4_seq1:115-2061(+)